MARESGEGAGDGAMPRKSSAWKYPRIPPATRHEIRARALAVRARTHCPEEMALEEAFSSQTPPVSMTFTHTVDGVETAGTYNWENTRDWGGRRHWGSGVAQPGRFRMHTDDAAWQPPGADGQAQPGVTDGAAAAAGGAHAQRAPTLAYSSVLYAGSAAALLETPPVGSHPAPG
ncbi:hypothetical protein T484DRAFT_1895289 [Baffinella frigidus]|nr:hypothetical protein T484DRAFT_1895289 [Cryptophyta sp. CCMP2293]